MRLPRGERLGLPGGESESPQVGTTRNFKTREDRVHAQARVGKFP